MDRENKGKIIAILALCGCIVIGLLYLIVLGVVKPKVVEVEATVTPTIESTVEPTATPIPTPTPTIYDTTSNDSLYRIVNASQTIDSSYIPSNLVKVDSSKISMNKSHTLTEETYNALVEMNEAAKSAGYSMRLLSGYRSYEEQVSLYNYYVREYSQSWADEIDDHPGSSEHQLGLCIDIGEASSNCDLNACFANSSLYTWLHENCYKYGFIERYPEGKQEVTGIIYSPWHYRYVGKELAEKIYNSGLTLEEYCD